MRETAEARDSAGAVRRTQAQSRVRDLMTSPAVAAAPGASLEEVAGLLADGHAGAVPVTASDGLLLGLITEGDLQRDPGPREPVAAAVMSAPVVAVAADRTPAEAQALMIRHRIRHLPVVDPAGRLAGMIGEGRVVGALDEDEDEDESEIRSAIVAVVHACGGTIIALDVCEGVVRLHARVADAAAARALEQRVRVTAGVRVLIPTTEHAGELSAAGRAARDGTETR